MADHHDSKGQPAPDGDGTGVLMEVISDLVIRRNHGIEKYGTELKANNGRKALVDLYQELLDAVMYTKQKLIEDNLTGPLVYFTDREQQLLELAVTRWHNETCQHGGSIAPRVLKEGTGPTELAALIYKLVDIRR